MVAQETLRLWPGIAPGDEGLSLPPEQDITTPEHRTAGGRRITRIGNVTVPTLTVYPAPAETNTGTAVIVCPGGGYNYVATDIEGTEICTWLNSLGVTGVLLKYRTPPRPGVDRHVLPLQDAQRAMGLLRQQADRLGINPARIGIMGFSAGAHLAAVLSNNFAARTYARLDDADDLSCRPDFALLLYPGSIRQSDGRPNPEVTPAAGPTPPTFLAMTQDDSVGVENAIVYYAALHAAGVPTTMHLYPTGGHGYGLRDDGHRVTQWGDRAAEWLADLGLLTGTN